MEKHVAIITGVFPPMLSGIADYIEILSTRLKNAGWRVSIITSKQGHQQSGEFDVFPIMRKWEFSERQILCDKLTELEPSVIFVHHGGDMYYENKLVESLPRYIQTPVVTMIHDRIAPGHKPFFRRSFKSMAASVMRAFGVIDPNYLWLLKRSRMVLFSNADDESFYLENYLSVKGRTKVIPLGPCIPVPKNLTAARQKFGITDSVKIIGFHGFLLPNKGLELLADARARLAGAMPGAVLFVIGGDSNNDYSKKIRQYINSKGLEQKVFWSGHLPPDEVAGAIKCCDVVALPFDSGVSFKRSSFINCIACGVPVITTKPSGVLPKLVDGDNVLTIPPGDVEALVVCLKRVLSDDMLRNRLITGSLNLAKYFDWDSIIADIDDVLSGR